MNHSGEEEKDHADADRQRTATALASHWQKVRSSAVTVG